MKKDFDTAIRMGKEIYDFLSLFGYDGRFVRQVYFTETKQFS